MKLVQLVGKALFRFMFILLHPRKPLMKRYKNTTPLLRNHFKNFEHLLELTFKIACKHGSATQR